MFFQKSQNKELYAKGPYVVFCRGHSGGRILSEAFAKNGIYMGSTTPKKWDTVEFGTSFDRKNSYAISKAFEYPHLPEKQQKKLENIIRRRIEYLRECADGKPFGWKSGSSIFYIEMVLRMYPDAKVVHLIRDGRDVCMSELNARLSKRKVEKKHNKIMIFGHPNVKYYKGLRLRDAVLDKKLRCELEMYHWKTAVSFGMRGRKFPQQYSEVLYEDLCREPLENLQKIFDFIGMPTKPEVTEWAQENIKTGRMQKWKGKEEQLKDAFEIGEELLRKLNYIE